MQIIKIRIASDFGCRRDIRSSYFNSRLGELSPTLLYPRASTNLPFSLSPVAQKTLLCPRGWHTYAGTTELEPQGRCCSLWAWLLSHQKSMGKPIPSLRLSGSQWQFFMMHFPRWVGKVFSWHLEGSSTLRDRKTTGLLWYSWEIVLKKLFFHKILCLRDYLGRSWAPHINQKPSWGRDSIRRSPCTTVLPVL